MAKQAAKKSLPADKPKCGLVMPISGSEKYRASHWAEVKRIIDEALNTRYSVELVSDSDEVGVIHKRIVQNLHDNPIVVCDVSSLNPNCMLELGMRLAFDMPTVLIADDATPFKFDTSPIDHLIYPRDLRFYDVKEFQEKLYDRVVATEAMRAKDPKATVFLGHFVEYTRKKIPTEEIASSDLVLKRLDKLENLLSNPNRSPKPSIGKLPDSGYPEPGYYLTLLGASDLSSSKLGELVNLKGVKSTRYVSEDELGVIVAARHRKEFNEFTLSSGLIQFAKVEGLVFSNGEFEPTS